jgi:DNA-binding GntR family transcriptional regulator
MRAAGEKKYLQGQPERHRAILEALRARYEGEAAKSLDVRPKGA